MASAPPPASAQPSRTAAVLQALARAYFARERQRLGIGAEEREAQAASTTDLVKRAQLARLAQEMELAPAESGLRTRLVEAQIRNYDEPNRLPPAPPKPGTPHYTTNEAGEVTAVVPQPDGTFKQIPLGRIGQRPADIRPDAGGGGGHAPGRLSPLVDANGNVVATFHNVTGEVTPIKGAPTPGAPAVVGDTQVRRSPLNATERKDKTGLELAYEGTQELRRLLALPQVREAIGFVSGRWQDAKRKTIGAAPEVQELFRTSDRLAEFLLRALSGAQINESEYSRLRTLLPDPRAHISKYESDLNLFERELQSTLAKRFPGAQPGGVTPPAGGDADPLGILGGGR